MRLAEHKQAVRMGDVNNGIAVHSLKTGHSIAWDKAKITDRETHWQRRNYRQGNPLAKEKLQTGKPTGKGEGSKKPSGSRRVR